MFATAVLQYNRRDIYIYCIHYFCSQLGLVMDAHAKLQVPGAMFTFGTPAMRQFMRHKSKIRVLVVDPRSFSMQLL